MPAQKNRLVLKLALPVALIALSAALYGIHHYFFHDLHHIFIYLLGDIAFIPIDVLIVALIMNRILESREKKAKLKKLNMVIGAFFSEVGNTLISVFAAYDPDIGTLRDVLFRGQGFASETKIIKVKCAAHPCRIAPVPEVFHHLKTFLAEKLQFLLRLLENPNLLEHDSFSDVLWAVFHLADELVHRSNLNACPAKDLDHLAGDAQRAYSRIVGVWMSYMLHLKSDYPYLFSLALRLNPFDPDARVEID